jgi:hypothetical protein
MKKQLRALMTISFLLFFCVGVLFPQTDTAQVNMSEIIIRANRPKEEALVGPYKQPEWTTRRRFPSTRVYIQTLPGKVEFEQWMEVRIPKSDSKNAETRMRTEFAFGFTDRIQLDLYLNTVHKRNEANSSFGWRGWSGEIRYALADWGVLPGNPTLYFEYLFFNGDPDKIEPKILLGDELASNWHWGINGVYEREIAGAPDRDEEWKITGALGYTLIDEKLSLGSALEYSVETERASGIDDETTHEVLIGPSLQWRPIKNAHFDIEPLYGVTDESKRMKMYLVFGWDF